MKINPNIDELLNSYIDAELPQDQQAELQQLIADDPQVARQLRQLQACRILVSSLPRAEAPAETLQRVRASLQTSTLQDQRRLSSDAPGGPKYVLVRKVGAVAALIAVVAVLAAAIYTIMTAGIGAQKPTAQAPVATTQFRGRLELTTGAFVAVDSFISRAIEDNRLSDYVSSTKLGGKKVYSLSCTKQRLNLLLADLSSEWRRFDSAALFVETEQFGEPIVLSAVTAEQAVEIVNQDSSEACMELARDFAVLNSVAELMPGKDVLAAVGGKGVDLMTIPKPVLTSRQKTAKEASIQAEDAEKVTLTIVISGSE